jgi:hypothetical protein
VCLCVCEWIFILIKYTLYSADETDGFIVFILIMTIIKR